jgi:hypothetical protein
LLQYYITYYNAEYGKNVELVYFNQDFGYFKNDEDFYGRFVNYFNLPFAGMIYLSTYGGLSLDDVGSDANLWLSSY